MPIKIKIDVTKALKQHFFHGKEKPDGSHPIYMDVILWETPDDQYGNDYRVVQDLNKEARDAGEKGPILGNGKCFGESRKPAIQPDRSQRQPPVKSKPPADIDLDPSDDEIPFGG